MKIRVVQGMARMQGATASAEIEQAGLSPPDDAGEVYRIMLSYPQV